MVQRFNHEITHIINKILHLHMTICKFNEFFSKRYTNFSLQGYTNIGAPQITFAIFILRLTRSYLVYIESRKNVSFV